MMADSVGELPSGILRRIEKSPPATDEVVRKFKSIRIYIPLRCLSEDLRKQITAIHTLREEGKQYSKEGRTRMAQRRKSEGLLLAHSLGAQLDEVYERERRYQQFEENSAVVVCDGLAEEIATLCS